MRTMTVERATTACREARVALREHGYECSLWDYESNGGCRECERLEAALREAAARLAGVTLRDARGHLPGCDHCGWVNRPGADECAACGSRGGAR